MQYMLFMCDDGAQTAGPAEITAMPEFVTWQKDLEARGVSHRGARLRPAAEAVTVRVRDGQLLITDGPFAETKDQISGYELIECSDLDEAIEIASKHPVAAFGAIEVRPFWPQ
jgi:hypothetical protein